MFGFLQGSNHMVNGMWAPSGPTDQPVPRQHQANNFHVKNGAAHLGMYLSDAKYLDYLF